MDKMTVHDSSNLAFVAALVSYGASVKRTNKEDRRRVIFSVDISEISAVYTLVDGEVITREVFDYEDLLNLFVSDRLMLMPNYMTKVTDLKSLIYG